jgi:hypothetical protein
MRNNGEQSMYTAVAILRNGQMLLQWVFVQMFLAFNAIGIPFAFGDGQDHTTAAKLAFSMMGIVIHLVFAVAIRRGDDLMQEWDGELADLEGLDGEGSDVVRVRVFSRPGFSLIRDARSIPVEIFTPVCVAFVIVWGGISIYHSSAFF